MIQRLYILPDWAVKRATCHRLSNRAADHRPPAAWLGRKVCLLQTRGKRTGGSRRAADENRPRAELARRYRWRAIERISRLGVSQACLVTSAGIAWKFSFSTANVASAF